MKTPKDNQNPNYIKIGTAMEGGYFGGTINVNGTHKGIIVSPKKNGSLSSFLLPIGECLKGATSPNDCLVNMKVLLAVGSPAAKLVAQLNIGGFQDWVIPSRDVLELCYRNFKPTEDENACSWRDGDNSNSIPPCWGYKEDLPTQTTLDAFKENGEESFDPDWYWSSTIVPHGMAAFCQIFTIGSQDGCDVSSALLVRAVRLIPSL